MDSPRQLPQRSRSAINLVFSKIISNSPKVTRTNSDGLTPSSSKSTESNGGKEETDSPSPSYSPTSSQPGTPLSSYSPSSPRRNVLFEGILSKKDDFGMFKNYKDFYFCVRDGQLVYYKDKEARESNSVLGYIPLHKSTVESVGKDSRKIKISNKDQFWIVRAPSPDDRDFWLRALKNGTQRETKIKGINKKEGFLERQTGLGAWERCFFAIKDGKLSRSKTEHQIKSVSYPLLNSVLHENIPSDDDFYTFSIVTSVDTKKKTILLRTNEEKEYKSWIKALQIERDATNRLKSGFSTFRSISMSQLPISSPVQSRNKS